MRLNYGHNSHRQSRPADASRRSTHDPGAHDYRTPLRRPERRKLAELVGRGADRKHSASPTADGKGAPDRITDEALYELPLATRAMTGLDEPDDLVHDVWIKAKLALDSSAWKRSGSGAQPPAATGTAETAAASETQCAPCPVTPP